MIVVGNFWGGRGHPEDCFNLVMKRGNARNVMCSMMIIVNPTVHVLKHAAIFTY